MCNSEFHARVQSAILPKMKNCQYGTFERLQKIQKIFLLKHYETVINQKNSGSAESMIQVIQSTKRGFSKEALAGFKKSFLFWVCMNPSNP